MLIKMKTVDHVMHGKLTTKSALFLRIGLALLVAEASSAKSANVYVTWQNGIAMSPDTSNTITMPNMDQTVSVYGTITSNTANPYTISSGDYLSILTNLQGCGSTMDMRNGVLAGLGMILLDEQFNVMLPLSIVPVAKYTMCICPASSTQVISGAIICRDQAGLDTGLKVSTSLFAHF